MEILLKVLSHFAPAVYIYIYLLAFFASTELNKQITRAVFINN